MLEPYITCQSLNWSELSQIRKNLLMTRQGIPTTLTLEKIANGAVIVSVLIAITILCHNLFVKNAKPQITRGLAKGQMLPPLTNYNRYQNTLFLVMNAECGYCKSSVPFYQRLIASAQDTNRSLHIIAVFPNDAADVDRFLRENTLEVEKLTNINLNQLMTDATPALILANAKGEVADFWIGKLDENQQSQILASLFHENDRKGASP
jgi:hypothetical protein